MSNEKEEKIIRHLRSQKENNDSFIFKIPEHLERKNIAYHSIILDLKTCKEALLQLQEINSEIVQTSLFTTVIILYGKCFTDSSSTKSPKLQSDLFSSENENLKKLHLNLMNMRHNFVAHRGQTEHEFGKAYFQVYPKTNTWGIKVALQRRHSFEKIEIPNYLELINHLIRIAVDKYDKVGKKIISHIMTKYNYPGSGKNELELLNEIGAELENYVTNIKRKRKKYK
ncbi:hypothetical protein ABN763_12925 [Spongiivirga sp. MCCC 1A20706]|uniref:hypothetical protein n=1 Tax=Spongiivirga sp. MCCC 1A20706 TaxID=3160963 RepID=UPI003977D661